MIEPINGRSETVGLNERGKTKKNIHDLQYDGTRFKTDHKT